MSTHYTRNRPQSNKATVSPFRIATWNLENFGDDPRITAEKAARIGRAIVEGLENPHIIALQEMCDDSGALDDGTTSAAANAQKLIDAISNARGAEYRYTEIAPKNNHDGGKTGSNIRCGFLYRPDRATLVTAHQPNNHTQPIADIAVEEGQLKLRHTNPSLIDPNNSAFIDSRKPLVAHFKDRETAENYFVTNLHLASNGFVANATPQTATPNAAPWVVNPHRLSKREKQAEIVAQFVDSVSARLTSKSAHKQNHIIVCGDFNAADRVLREGVDQPVDIKALDTLSKSGLIDASQGKLHNIFSVGHGDNAMTIDYIFVSHELHSRLGNITRPTLTRDNKGISDHNPTVLCIAAPQKAKAPDRRVR